MLVPCSICIFESLETLDRLTTCINALVGSVEFEVQSKGDDDDQSACQHAGQGGNSEEDTEIADSHSFDVAKKRKTCAINQRLVQLKLINLRLTNQE